MVKIRQDKTVKFFISVIGLVVVALTLKELSHIFIPFVIAYFLFFVFSPLNEFLQKEKVPTFLIVLLDIFITVMVIWGAFSFIIDSVVQFAAMIPQYEDKLNTIVRNMAKGVGISDPYFKNFSLSKVIKNIDYKLLAGDVINSTFSVLGNILFILFFFVFVVTGHKTILEAIRRRYIIRKVEPELRHLKKTLETSIHDDAETEKVLDTTRHDKEIVLTNTFKAITSQIQRYIIAKIGVNLAAGVTVTIVFMILKIDFPIVWGLVTFLLNFIPSIGSAIALIFPVGIVFLQSGSTSFTILVAAIMGGIQTLFFNVIEPLLIGKRLNLNPLLILLSVLIWGYIWGIVGMLLAVPLTAVIKIIISNSESKDLNFMGDLMSN